MLIRGNMNKQEKAMQMALTVLEDYVDDPRCENEIKQAVTALQDALSAAPVQESDDLTIAYMVGYEKGKTVAQRQWVGLTDEEIDQGLLRSDYALQTAHAWRAGVVFAMTKLKEKNT